MTDLCCHSENPEIHVRQLKRAQYLRKANKIWQKVSVKMGNQSFSIMEGKTTALREKIKLYE